MLASTSLAFHTGYQWCCQSYFKLLQQAHQLLHKKNVIQSCLALMALLLRSSLNWPSSMLSQNGEHNADKTPPGCSRLSHNLEPWQGWRLWWWWGGKLFFFFQQQHRVAGMSEEAAMFKWTASWWDDDNWHLWHPCPAWTNAKLHLVHPTGQTIQDKTSCNVASSVCSAERFCHLSLCVLYL